MRRKYRNTIGMSILNLFFIIVCLLAVIPILYTFSVSINAKNDFLNANFKLIPSEFTLRNYKAVLFENPFFSWLWNSLLLSFFTVLTSLTFSVPCAYAFSRYHFKGRKSILYILLMLNAFPAILSMSAVYRIIRIMGLLNSFLGLVLIYTGTMVIFGIWNLKGYFDTLPLEIEEAAKIDGANDFQVVCKIILPLAKPSIIVTAVLVLIYVWSEYIYVVTFVNGTDKYTLAAGLYSLQATEYTRNWPLFSTASLLVAIPMLVIFFIIQRHMVSGLTAGSIK